MVILVLVTERRKLRGERLVSGHTESTLRSSDDVRSVFFFTPVLFCTGKSTRVNIHFTSQTWDIRLLTHEIRDKPCKMGLFIKFALESRRANYCVTLQMDELRLRWYSNSWNADKNCFGRQTHFSDNFLWNIRSTFVYFFYITYFF